MHRHWPTFRSRPQCLHRLLRPVACTCRCSSSHSTAKSDDSSYRGLNYASFVDPSSLRKTVDAVREANRSRLIRKVDQDGHPAYLKLDTPRPAEDSSKRSLDPYYRGARHVFLNTPDSKRHRSESAVHTRPSRKKKKTGPADSNPSFSGAARAYPITPHWKADENLARRWRLPWLSFTKTHNVSARQRLVDEINAFARYMEPNVAEASAVAQVFNDVKLAFQSIAPPYELELMGSRASGLAGPLSDLDVNLRPTSGTRLDDVGDRSEALSALRQMAKTFRQQRFKKTNPSVQNLKLTSFRDKARVPVIGLEHTTTSLEVQIQHTVSGYNSTEYAKAFVKEHPNLKAIFLVLRQMLAMRGLDQGNHGGLTSYPLLNLIVAHIKLGESSLDCGDQAGQLLTFLERYSKIDFGRTRLSVSPPSCDMADVMNMHAPKKAPEKSERMKRWNSTYRMSLIDPADPSNDLGRSCSAIRHVQETLIETESQLHHAMETWDHSIEMGQEPPDTSLLACMLEGDYRDFELDRASLKTDGIKQSVEGSFGA